MISASNNLAKKSTPAPIHPKTVYICWSTLYYPKTVPTSLKFISYHPEYETHEIIE